MTVPTSIPVYLIKATLSADGQWAFCWQVIKSNGAGMMTSAAHDMPPSRSVRSHALRLTEELGWSLESALLVLDIRGQSFSMPLLQGRFSVMPRKVGNLDCRTVQYLGNDKTCYLGVATGTREALDLVHRYASRNQLGAFELYLWKNEADEALVKKEFSANETECTRVYPGKIPPDQLTAYRIVLP